MFDWRMKQITVTVNVNDPKIERMVFRLVVFVDRFVSDGQ